MKLSTKQKDVKQVKRVEFDRKRLNEYTIFRTLNRRSEKDIEYYYGGGVYNEDYDTLELFLDCIRPKRKSIPISNVIHAAFNNNCCDIMLSDGTWISGLKVKKINSNHCCFQRRLFNDRRIIVPYENYMVVSLHLLEVESKNKVKFLRGVSMSPEILRYKNPLTFMYTRKDDNVYIGYWDVIEQEPIGELQEFSSALDIFA